MAFVNNGDGAGQKSSRSAAAYNSQGAQAAVIAALQPPIQPREQWAQGSAPPGPLQPEPDVRILVVHHTASSNTYLPNEVVGELRSFYRLHTSPQKGWPDIAYNFLIDRYGGIWEGRAGSLAGPVQADATGGSQGFSQLCCLIGDFTSEAPTAEAIAALNATLAWLAERDGVPTEPGATASFPSRGSSLWPTGTTVDTRTIAGHRDMSNTSCPGDFVYSLLAEQIPVAVNERRQAAGLAVAPTSTTAPPTSQAPSTQAPSTETPATDPATTQPTTPEQAVGPTVATYRSQDPRADAAFTVAGTAAAVLGGLLWVRTRRQQRPEP